MASAVINVAPEGNLSRYLQEIRKFPMLSPEEELALSKRWRDHQDMEAAHKLVTSHLRLVAKIARMLDVPEQDVISMNRRLAAPDHSLNATVRQDSEGEWQDWLVDETESQEASYADREELSGRKALLSGALKTLNERERHILIERRLKDNPTTLEDLSQQYGISRERVRQIEVRAFEKLQKAMKSQIAERRQQSHSAAAARQAVRS